MRRRALSLLLAGASWAAACRPTAHRPPATARPELDYAFTLEAPLAVAVRLEVDGEPDGETVFEVASRWGGVPSGGEDLGELEASTIDGRPLPATREAPHRWSVAHDSGERLAVGWRIAPNDHQSSVDPAISRRTILNEGLLHGYGELLLVRPADMDAETPRRVRVSWTGFDEAGWTIADSFGLGPGPRETTASLHELRQSIWTAGRLEVVTREVHGSLVHVAVEDGFPFEARAFADIVARIVAIERELFDDLDHDPFLVSLVSVGRPGPGSSSYGGTGLTRSFSLQVQAGADIAPGSPERDGLLELLAHEMLHAWNGVLLRLEQPEALGYWFSEGFTTFLARRHLLDAGLVDRETWTAWTNRSLAELFTSPVARLPNDAIEGRYWSERAVKDLPYRRGEIVALLTDHGLRRRSGGARGLADLVAGLVDEARRTGLRASTPLLLERLDRELDPELAAHLRSVVEEGELPSVAGDAAGPCFRVRSVGIATFDLGFDFETSSRDGVVSGVRRGSQAEGAGLEDGQPLVGWSIHHGRPDRPAVMQVRVDGTVQDIEWLPRGPEAQVPQLETLPGCGGP